MKRVNYALRFTGQASPQNDAGTVMKAATSSPSSSIATQVSGAGLSCQVSPIEGDEATFESEVRMGEGGKFDEDGTITFGAGNSLRFETVGEGELGPSPNEGTNAGCISWRIVSGTGQFEGAAGYITSNFTVSAEGAVEDNQFGVIWVK